MVMKITIKACLGLILISLASCQNQPSQKETNHLDLLYPQGKELPKICLVGTFHFGYPNADVHKTEESDQIDVLSKDRQREMRELREYISTFRPNKLVIESREPEKWNKAYNEFLKGELEPKRDERVQLGFYIGQKFGIDTLYCLDAGSFAQTYAGDSCRILEKVFEDYDLQSDDPVEKDIFSYFDRRDQRLKSLTLLEYFKELNSPASWNLNYGSYLIGDFKLPNYTGTDALATYWYSRNLRTFRKIQEITESKDDRILVIFGNGHISILDHLFSCSPEYNYVPFGSLK